MRWWDANSTDPPLPFPVIFLTEANEENEGGADGGDNWIERGKRFGLLSNVNGVNL